MSLSSWSTSAAGVARGGWRGAGSPVGSAEPIPGVLLVQGLCWFLVG